MARKSEKPQPKGLPLPDATYKPGWPQQLTDTTGVNYWRLIDGEPQAQYNYSGGQAVQYGKILTWKQSRPQVDGKYMCFPVGDFKTTDNVTLSCGNWDGSLKLEDTFDVIYE